MNTGPKWESQVQYETKGPNRNKANWLAEDHGQYEKERLIQKKKHDIDSAPFTFIWIK